MIRVAIIAKDDQDRKLTVGFESVPREGDEISINGVLARVDFVRWTKEDDFYRPTVYLDRPAPLVES